MFHYLWNNKCKWTRWIKTQRRSILITYKQSIGWTKQIPKQTQTLDMPKIYFLYSFPHIVFIILTNKCLNFLFSSIFANYCCKLKKLISNNTQRSKVANATVRHIAWWRHTYDDVAPVSDNGCSPTFFSVVIISFPRVQSEFRLNKCANVKLEQFVMNETDIFWLSAWYSLAFLVEEDNWSWRLLRTPTLNFIGCLGRQSL